MLLSRRSRKSRPQRRAFNIDGAWPLHQHVGDLRWSLINWADGRAFNCLFTAAVQCPPVRESLTAACFIGTTPRVPKK